MAAGDADNDGRRLSLFEFALAHPLAVFTVVLAFVDTVSDVAVVTGMLAPLADGSCDDDLSFAYAFEYAAGATVDAMVPLGKDEALVDHGELAHSWCNWQSPDEHRHSEFFNFPSFGRNDTLPAGLTSEHSGALPSSVPLCTKADFGFPATADQANFFCIWDGDTVDEAYWYTAGCLTSDADLANPAVAAVDGVYLRDAAAVKPELQAFCDERFDTSGPVVLPLSLAKDFKRFETLSALFRRYEEARNSDEDFNTLSNAMRDDAAPAYAKHCSDASSSVCDVKCRLRDWFDPGEGLQSDYLQTVQTCCPSLAPDSATDTCGSGFQAGLPVMLLLVMLILPVVLTLNDCRAAGGGRAYVALLRRSCADVPCLRCCASGETSSATMSPEQTGASQSSRRGVGGPSPSAAAATDVATAPSDVEAFPYNSARDVGAQDALRDSQMSVGDSGADERAGRQDVPEVVQLISTWLLVRPVVELYEYWAPSQRPADAPTIADFQGPDLGAVARAKAWYEYVKSLWARGADGNASVPPPDITASSLGESLCESYFQSVLQSLVFFAPLWAPRRYLIMQLDFANGNGEINASKNLLSAQMLSLVFSSLSLANSGSEIDVLALLTAAEIGRVKGIDGGRSSALTALSGSRLSLRKPNAWRSQQDVAARPRGDERGVGELEMTQLPPRGVAATGVDDSAGARGLNADKAADDGTDSKGADGAAGAGGGDDDGAAAHSAHSYRYDPKDLYMKWVDLPARSGWPCCRRANPDKREWVLGVAHKAGAKWSTQPRFDEHPDTLFLVSGAAQPVDDAATSLRIGAFLVRLADMISVVLFMAFVVDSNVKLGIEWWLADTDRDREFVQGLVNENPRSTGLGMAIVMLVVVFLRWLIAFVLIGTSQRDSTTTWGDVALGALGSALWNMPKAPSFVLAEDAAGDLDAAVRKAEADTTGAGGYFDDPFGYVDAVMFVPERVAVHRPKTELSQWAKKVAARVAERVAAQRKKMKARMGGGMEDGDDGASADEGSSSQARAGGGGAETNPADGSGDPTLPSTPSVTSQQRPRRLVAAEISAHVMLPPVLLAASAFLMELDYTNTDGDAGSVFAEFGFEYRGFGIDRIATLLVVNCLLRLPGLIVLWPYIPTPRRWWRRKFWAGFTSTASRRNRNGKGGGSVTDASGDHSRGAGEGRLPPDAPAGETDASPSDQRDGEPRRHDNASFFRGARDHPELPLRFGYGPFGEAFAIWMVFLLGTLCLSIVFATRAIADENTDDERFGFYRPFFLPAGPQEDSLTDVTVFFDDDAAVL